MGTKNSYKYKDIDLTGKRHERLTVISKSKNGRSRYICKCDCGNVIELPAHRFFDYKSCGCLEKENKTQLTKYTRTHGMTETKLYKAWCGIKARCNNPNTPHYERYGGRGISVCDEWMNSFEDFRDWAFSAGYQENDSCKKLSIDRINPNGNYEPSNCRWITQKEQSRNRENSRYISVNHEMIPLEQFAEEEKIPNYFIRRRLEKGQSSDEIIHDWKMLHETPQGYMDVRDAMKYYNVCYVTIIKWIKSGLLKAERYGQKWYIPNGQSVKNESEGRDAYGRFIKGHNH